MASRASPSSSSEVEDLDEVEEIRPLIKRRRYSDERQRRMESDSTDHCAVGRTTNCLGSRPGTSAASSHSFGSRSIDGLIGVPANVINLSYCTNKPGGSSGSSVSAAAAAAGAAADAAAAATASGVGGTSTSSGLVGRIAGGSSVRSATAGSGKGIRGSISEKDSKSGSGRTGFRTSSGKGSSGGRNMKEQWLVNGGRGGGASGGDDIANGGRWRAGDLAGGSGRGGVEEQISSSQGGEPAELASLQARLRQRDEIIFSQKQAAENLFRELQESVECPVCFSIPRMPPVPCCKNGHVICARCKDKVDVCPTCRVEMTGMTSCVNQVAATIIQRIQHPCDFREAGCDRKFDIHSIDEHEESCKYRLVRCPHWACDEMISLTALTSHVISSECGDNYMTKTLPYQEEIEYTRALDDQDGSSFWRPSLLQFQNITFYLQIEKSGKNRQWYFYVQMEGSASLCQEFGTQITVCKSPSDDHFSKKDLFSICYYGKVCPIDTKGAEEIEHDGCGLNVRDAVMEKIFTIDTNCLETAQPVLIGKEVRDNNGSLSDGLRLGGSGCGGSAGVGGNGVGQSGEKEEGEVGDQVEEGEGERYKFWVKVNIFKVNE